MKSLAVNYDKTVKYINDTGFSHVTFTGKGGHISGCGHILVSFCMFDVLHICS